MHTRTVYKTQYMWFLYNGNSNNVRFRGTLGNYGDVVIVVVRKPDLGSDTELEEIRSTQASCSSAQDQEEFQCL